MLAGIREGFDHYYAGKIRSSFQATCLVTEVSLVVELTTLHSRHQMGFAQASSLSVKNFIGNDNVALCLATTSFWANISEQIASNSLLSKQGRRFWLFYVSDPNRFWCGLKVDDKGKAVSI